MFTGIIQEIGTVKTISKKEKGGQDLRISCSFANDCHVDESISVNGVCLTVVDFNETSFLVQCVEETLRKTSLGELKEGEGVNLERSLTLEKGIEGHLVQGHVDTTGTISAITEENTGWLIDIEYPKEQQNMIVGRGSITVEGISLTVAEDLGNTFRIAIIPYTWEHTNLNTKAIGDKVNLEFDIIGKYVVKYLSGINKDS